jgi:uncharacterized membrane protein
MAERVPRKVRLDTPVNPRRGVPRPHYDPDAFGRVSEQIARFLGTARFLVYLTALVILWLTFNTFAPERFQFDPRALNYTLLTLILSLQASYAAPLILLAQNRQVDRDRIRQEEDRAENDRLQADVEYLTREVAGLRQTLGEVATRDFLRDQLREVTEEVVARSRETSMGAEQAQHDHAATRKREDRERRAERKKRRAGQRVEDSAAAKGLSEPFVGEDEPA